MSYKYFISSICIITLIFLLTPVNAATPKYDISFEVPLVIAADRGNLYEIKRLIKNGTNLNKQDTFGVTALMRAVFRGNSEIVRELLDAGADVHIKDIGGATALHLASRLGNKSITNMLLKYGANPNATDTEGYSPLERAIKGEREGVVQAIISEGADLNHKGQSGFTPAELAFQGNNKRIQQIFNETKPITVAMTPKEIKAPRHQEEKIGNEEDSNIQVTTQENSVHQSIEEKQPLEEKITEIKPVIAAAIPENLNKHKVKKAARNQENNILGTLRNQKNSTKAIAKKTKIEEPPVSKVEENTNHEITPVHQVMEREKTSYEQSFNILSWFGFQTPLPSKEQENPLEKEVAYTIAEDEQLIGPEVIINQPQAEESVKSTQEKEFMIADDVLGPEVVLQTTKSAPDIIIPVDNYSIVKDLKNSTAPKPLKNKELIVTAIKVPDDFLANSVVKNLTAPITYHVEIGSFKTSYEAKKFIKSNLSKYIDQADVIDIEKGYKIIIKGFNQNNAQQLCSTLAKPKSKRTCAALSKLSTVSDSSFYLY